MSRGAFVRLLALGGLVACGQSEPLAEPSADVAGPVLVFTVNYPLLYFAVRIGGDHAKAVLPAPPGVDPAHWSPDPETIAGYQGADLVLLNGLGYASWVDRASLRRSRLIDTSVSFAGRAIPIEGSVLHTHGPEGAHSHRGLAFTSWLDPELAIAMSAVVRDALSAALPAWQAEFEAGAATLTADLEALDRQLAAATARIGSQPLVFSHPVYQYLARRYGLNGRSLEWEPDESPTERMWRDLERLLREHPARWMIWEAEPLPDTLRRLSRLGLRSVVYEPCGTAPEQGDFLRVMRANAGRLEEIGDASQDPL